VGAPFLPLYPDQHPNFKGFSYPDREKFKSSYLVFWNSPDATFFARVSD
jgi:hypothetical protein